MTELPGTAWLAIPDYQYELFDELSIDPARSPASAKPGKGVSIWGDLVYREGTAPRTFWHRNVLSKPFIAEFSSIREAADILRGIQRNWAHYPVASFRRAELIKEKLPYINEKPRSFPYAVPRSPMGVWSLLDERTLFASAVTSSPFPAGIARFEEDHVNPPSRAYLKMYEALSWAEYFAGERADAGEPGIPTGRYTTSDGTTTNPIAALIPPGSRIVDAGACPGGWTWALDKLGATVTAIDRAPLADTLMAKPNITFIKHDAFTLKPADLGEQDWVCSDVICYPERLLEWVHLWLDSGLCKNFICTIKMQGKADHAITRTFADIPGSRVVHLTANKHELTWIRMG
jgi:23S rRNA (cytidine2498-2'-O)-methyltransferase